MTNLEVARRATLRPIADVADSAGLLPDDYECLGRHKAKLTDQGVRRASENPRKGKLVLVTAISPTPKGEGKTTVTVGLSQALNQTVRTVSATREPALGPIFGVKGGACGGGYSQVLPMEDINLFFTGDFPAISAAHNLLSAMVDASLHSGNSLKIDPRVDQWPRAVDMNDRALRSIVTGLGGKPNGPTREGSFVITPASEVMAVFCLSRSLTDLKRRLGDIVAAVATDGRPVTARELRADGAMAVLLRDALRPNLVQTVEGGLALVHGGPFGNIAHGCSSILATESALGLADFVVTEAGFGSDLGAEKFLDIVCPRLGRGPDAIVLVTTVRALVHHGSGDLAAGLPNLRRHLIHLQNYGPPVVVAVNQFEADSTDDHQLILDACCEWGVEAVVADPYAGGGNGCLALGELVKAAAARPTSFASLYTDQDSIRGKLQAVVSRCYGGRGAVLSHQAELNLAWIEKNGFGAFPVCVAKTQYSLSDAPALINAPEGFDLHVREMRVAAGAGFVVATCGDMMLMPGLGKTPAAMNIDLDEEGQIQGLF